MSCDGNHIKMKKLQNPLKLRSLIPALILTVLYQPKCESATPFIFDLESETIVSATFSADFAALTAHRFIGTSEVNDFTLMGSGGARLDLSSDLFGETEASTDVALIDQGLFETGIIPVNIDSAFFPAMAGGLVGYDGTFTDTNDALFAIDFLRLSIVTPSRTIEATINTNDGFGIGLPDGGTLPSGLPTSIVVGATGTGFDEAISSKAVFAVPEPSTAILFGTGLLLTFAVRRRRCNSSPTFSL